MPGREPAPQGQSGQSEVHCFPVKSCRQQSSQVHGKCLAGPMTSHSPARWLNAHRRAANPSRSPMAHPSNSREGRSSQELLQPSTDTPPPLLVPHVVPLSLREFWGHSDILGSVPARHIFCYSPDCMPLLRPDQGKSLGLGRFTGKAWEAPS